jgi:hypothetical protein
VGLFGRKKAQRREAEEREQLEAASRERALRLVDTRGVVVRRAEAELQAAMADVRLYATPERQRRLEEAKRAVAEARRLEEAAAAAAGSAPETRAG